MAPTHLGRAGSDHLYTHTIYPVPRNRKVLFIIIITIMIVIIIAKFIEHL